MKKILAIVLAMMLVLSMTAAFAADITITKGANDKAEHVYEAYQIFSGTVEDDQLKNIEWGAGVNGTALGAALVEAFKDCATETTKEDDEGNKLTVAQVFTAAASVNTAAAYAEAIGLITAAADLETLTDTINANVKADGVVTGDNNGVAGLEPGYYLVKDQNDSLEGKEDGAYTKFILKLLNEDIEVAEKAEVPTVEKEVQDEPDDAEEGATDGYGKSADHAINETFNFRVTATIPKDVNIANYDAYKVVFTDTMSDGVTFEEITSVTVDGTAIEATDYACTATAGQAGSSFTITIEDLKQLVELDGAQAADIVIVVTYKAHLNESAVIRDASGEAVTDNNNKVKLTYSNNADAYGTGENGETPEDTVFVFTYDVDNTKYADEIADDNKLPDAGFTVTDADGAEVVLIWDDTLSAYRPVKGEEEGSAEIFSKEDGTFNIVGLDAGTYTLTETTVPTGYNAVDPITVTITSVHKRNDTKTDATVTLTTENTDNDVVDESGTVLPSTGGIGTTIFTIVGSIMILAAAILLVTKRRMGADE